LAEVDISKGDNQPKEIVPNDETPNEAPGTPSGFSAKWTKALNMLHAPILNALQALTQTVVKNPKRTVYGISFFSIVLLVIGLFTNFSVDVDEDKLWTPSNSKAISHMDWIDDHSGFPEATHDLLLFFHSNGENVLGQEEVQKVFDVLDAVRGVNNYNEACSESDYVNSDGDNVCEIEGVVQFWGSDASVFEDQVSSDEQAIAAMSETVYPDGTPVSENSVFGKPQRDDDGTLTSVVSYTVTVKLPPTDAGESFEDDALDLLLDLRDDWAADKDNSLVLEVTAEGSFGDEFERAILSDIPLIPIVFIIMSIFCAAVFFKRDKVQSRSLLGFGAVLAVVQSLLSGFGFLFICGVPFTSMTQILPFVIFGIGLDDAFIISGAYSRTDPKTEIAERIRETIQEVGLSITSTSVTSALAFGLGCISSIPAVFWLCLYAFPTIIFIYIYQLTFFVACIVLDERRIQQNKRDCCFCITVETSDEPEEDEDNNNNNASASAPMMDRMMLSYAEFLLKPVTKVFVILAFTVLVVVCALSASQLEQRFEFTDVMPDDSYVTDFFDAIDEYTIRNSIAPYAYFRYVDQSQENMQQQMETYVDELVALAAVEEPPEDFWLWDFRTYISDEGLGELTFNQQVERFLSEPVYFDLYNGDIVRNEDGDITASRVQLYFDNVDVEDVNDQIDTLDDQRAVSKRQPVNQGESDWRFFSYDGIYNIWEFYAVSVEELIFTTIIGVVAVTGVALVFVPHFSGALFVLPMICLLYVDLLGVMNWGGVDVNAVSYIALVMSIGLLVDFVMHVLLRYYECPGNRREKVVEMLRTMGSSILIGGVSTFLGTLPLAFSTSTIFYTIFIAFVGLVTLGIGHGLILLPVLLSLFGPEDQIVAPSTEAPAVGDKEMDGTTRTSVPQKESVSSSS